MGIQEALAAALERAIASASVLLREALVGRIRACEAEKQVGVSVRCVQLEPQRIRHDARPMAGGLSRSVCILVRRLPQNLVLGPALDTRRRN